MADGLTLFLKDFSQMSNVGAIIVIITCLASMAIYLYRITSESAQRSDFNIYQQTPLQLMANVFNPFVIKLYQPHKASIQDGITLEITNRTPCTVHAFWGVNILNIYKVIHQPWQQFSESFSPENIHNILKDYVQHFHQPIILNCENTDNQLLLSPSKDLNLGSPPRETYPLVVVLLDAEGLHQSDKSNQVVAHISFFHIRDEHCSGESHIITQFVRSPNSGTVYNLQQLYVSGDSSEVPHSDNHFSQNSTSTAENQQICLICHSEPVSRVALPCRHACLCPECFNKIRKCPMCRQHITSYFTIGSESSTSYQNGSNGS